MSAAGAIVVGVVSGKEAKNNALIQRGKKENDIAARVTHSLLKGVSFEYNYQLKKIIAD
ncbi:hypothetical protein GCM10011405_31700 [Rufibacter glacialis]|nr:hypothetical protein GCM10011405_31700 [Rufibacter glacialis]